MKSKMKKQNAGVSGTKMIIGLVLSACFIYMMNCAVRNNFGLMLKSISESTGLDYASVSFVLAIGQMTFGVTQPLFGILAEKIGSKRTLILGIVLIAAGAILTPYCHTLPSLIFVLGILLPGATGALSFGIIMSVINDRIPAGRRTIVNGIVNASSGLGNTLFAPMIASAITIGGLASGMKVLAIPSLLMIPVALFMCAGMYRAEITDPSTKSPAGSASSGESVVRKIASAFSNRDYLFIVLGFFTCGFHMALITNHLPSQIMTYGYSYEAASGAFSVYGIATILGGLASGWLCSKFSFKNVLAAQYTSRAVMTIVFLLLPKTMPLIIIYIFLLGFTGSATVTPVSSICADLFGRSGMSVFFGFAFLAHQFGSFLSSWGAGIIFQRTQSYVLIWTIDIVLCLAAGIFSFLIRKNHQEIS